MSKEDAKFTFTTKPWQRGKSSQATTIPQEILAIKGAPVDDPGFRAEWSIDPETGEVKVDFVTVDTDDD